MGTLKFGIVLLAVVCYIQTSLAFTGYTGEDEADLALLLPYLYGALPIIYDRVMEMDLSETSQQHIGELSEEYGMDNFTGPSDKCVECRAFMGVLQTAVENRNFTEFEETFFDLCNVIVNASDGDLGIPEYICPGIAENYLADAYLVLLATDKDQTDICVLWNECLYYDFDPPLPEDTLVCKPPPIPRPAARAPRRVRHQRDLNNTIRIAHMTDIHVDLGYEIGAPTKCGMPTCCRYLWPGEGEAGYWGDYECNQPITLTDVMFQSLATLGPHYITYTGDNPPHTPWLDTYESQLDASRTLANSFQTYVPGVSVHYALGNHDIHPTNLYYYNRTEVKQGDIDLAGIWGPLANFGPEQYSTFENAAYYSILLQPGLRLLSYNSNFGWLENFYSLIPDGQPDYEEMKIFMESTLQEAALNGERVIVLGHHPTGQSQGHNEHSCFITDIHARYGDTIILHLSGHKHGDLYRLVRDINTGETRGVQISSPAGSTRSNRNPSLRIFHLDPVTFDVLDADTYRVNFTNYNGDPDDSTTPVLEFGYRFTDEYDMLDMSPEAFEDFIIRMETDEALFDKHWWNEGTANPDKVDDCDADCRFEEICQMKNTAYPGYLVCMGDI